MDETLDSIGQAAHFLEASSKTNVKLVTIRRADLKRAIADAPENELTAYLTAKATEAETKYVSVQRSKLLAACRTIVEAAPPTPEAPDAPPADTPDA